MMENNEKHILSNFMCIFTKLFVVLLSFLAVINIVFFKNNYALKFNSSKTIIFLLLYISFIVFAYLLEKKIKSLKIKDEHKKNIKRIIIGMAIIVQITYGIILTRKIGFDCGVVFDSAIELSNGNFTNVEYFSRYENNIFLLFFDEIVVRIANIMHINVYIFATIVNILFIDLSIFFIFKICKKLCNSSSLIVVIMSIFMLGISPYISVMYTDTLSLLFTTGIFYMYLNYKEKNKKIYIAYIALLSTLGLYMKPTNIIVLVAISCFEGINLIYRVFCKDKKLTKALLKEVAIIVSLFLFVVIITRIIFNSYKDYRLSSYITDEMYYKRSVPFTHFLMMGIKPVEYEGNYYGFYNEDDVQATISIIGKDNKTKYNLDVFKQRISNLGLTGYIKYLYQKYNCIISDGTFFYGSEGHFYVSEPIIKGQKIESIQKYFYKDKDEYNKYTNNLFQATWTFLLIVIFIGEAFILIRFIRKKEKINTKIGIVELSIIGIILFILLFEGRSRYLINYVPMFILLGSYCFDYLLKLKREKERILALDEERKVI